MFWVPRLQKKLPWPPPDSFWPATWVPYNAVPLWLLQVGVRFRILWGYSSATGRESMIPYRMILLNCIGCQWSKGLISRSWSLRIRLSTINRLITSPACFNYGLIPGTSAPHLLHLNLFSLELIISRLPIAPFHVMHLANGINCLLKSEMLIPSVSSKDFWNLISLNLLMDSSYVSFYGAKAP